MTEIFGPADLLRILTLVAIVGAGAMTGIFAAFTTAVLRALAEVPAGAGVTTMNLINLKIVNPAFLACFLGTVLVSVAVGVLSLLLPGVPGHGWRLAGAALILVGTGLLTAVVNVPANNALAAVDAADPEVESRWRRYLARWRPANRARALLTLAGTIALLIGLPPG